VPTTSSCEDHSIDFIAHFSNLRDSQQEVKLLYPLLEIILLTLCAVLPGANSWVAISAYGRKKLALLRRFLPF
jgi:hypothetical protein